eukprot:CAMPEP_0115828980 /NCGR_PEP_ID=MMETSP0287-20121206/859_1 /TAXON_ID=412157 /ORGANISM="Chrysochromulina rotalis, Strain UIO044" /LENGTH=394 /DNA_ID=CAMNT_0003282225 /DNA_START=16 /DNA_END=1200 /DNA_ORIENTATION=-
MSNLRDALAELGVSASDAMHLEAALQKSPPDRGVKASSVAALLQRISLEHYTIRFEEEALDDVALLLSMGSMLSNNLRELGLDESAIGKIASELKRTSYFSVDSPCSYQAHTTAITGSSPQVSTCHGRPRPPCLAAVFINLQNRTDRRAAMERVLPNVGLGHARRFEALCGEHIPEALVRATWDTALNAKFDRNCKVEPALDMSAGERGCAGSHIAIWRQCVTSNMPLLVLEDDVMFATPKVGIWTKALVTAIDAALHPSDPAMLLYLGAEASVREGAPSLRGKQAIWGAQSAPVACCLKEVVWAWQTHAYVIWPAAARVLLAGLPIDAPVDVYLSRHYYEGKVCALVAREPSLAEQHDPYRGGDVEHSSLRDRERMGMASMWRGTMATGATKF